MVVIIRERERVVSRARRQLNPLPIWFRGRVRDQSAVTAQPLPLLVVSFVLCLLIVALTGVQLLLWQILMEGGSLGIYQFLRLVGERPFDRSGERVRVDARLV